MKNVIWFEDLTMHDLSEVGGKNASLGEMISQLHAKNIRVPGGFATTASAYREFLSQNDLRAKIDAALASLDVQNVIALAKCGRQIQSWIMETPLPKILSEDIDAAYDELLTRYGNDISVAVRSSATAEDLPDASFAGQQDTFLNIKGVDQVKLAILKVFASLYNDRAISYRIHRGFKHEDVLLSVGVQKMVRSDIGSSGVAFTIDTESGFDKVIFITSSYGLGECIVQGMVNPDEFYVYKNALAANKFPIIRKTLGTKLTKMHFADVNEVGKSVTTVNVNEAEAKQFSLSDDKIIELAEFAQTIEDHYKKPMDIEWGLDGIDGQIYILQARPETVNSQQSNQQVRYHIKHRGHVLTTGRAIGQKVFTGVVRLVKNHHQMHLIKPGEILVTDITDPDWEPIMQTSGAIITNRGGRTCHAAIIARELGVPAVVGCENATMVLHDGMTVTVSCCEGDTGYIYEGTVEADKVVLQIDSMPPIPVKIMLNVGNPDLAFGFSSIPNHGVGLARLEFIINKQIGIHPKALIEYDDLPLTIKDVVRDRISGYRSPIDFYVDKLTEGIATIAAAFYPNPVIVRLSDFKSNEYANLIAGKLYEPIEENPMMGFRGASRYVSSVFQDCFELECRALDKVRNRIGLDNVIVMVPFVRTVAEAADVISVLASNGITRDNVKIYMMCEIPSNAILAEDFLQYFDGFSIGSNDMTQLILGIDRDASGAIASSFDERNPAVKHMLQLAIQACKQHGKYVGICGQGPSDHKEFADWLINQGIDTISLNPDSVIDTWIYLAEQQKKAS